MRIGQCCSLTSAWRAFQETLLDQERLVNLLNRTGILSHRRCNGAQSDWASIELMDNRTKNLIVHLIEPAGVDIQRLKRKTGNIERNASFPLTIAKSRTRRNSALAIRGVPRLRSAISWAA